MQIFGTDLDAQAIETARLGQYPDGISADVSSGRLDRIKQRQPEMVVVGLSLHDEGVVSRAMAEAGADAYVSKHDPAENLIEAIRQAFR